jgi:hypothetical protein
MSHFLRSARRTLHQCKKKTIINQYVKHHGFLCNFYAIVQPLRGDIAYLRIDKLIYL